MSMQRTTEHVGRNALQNQKNSATHCRCLHDIPRNARSQPWQKHHFLAKEFMRKIGKKGIYSSILDRFQNDEVCHASQLQHNWTKEWCEHLFAQSLSRTFGTIRYVVSFSVRSETNGKRTHKSRPNYHQTARAIVSMNKEASQSQESKRRHNYREHLARLVYMTLSQMEMVLRGKPNFKFKFHTMDHQKSAEAHVSGNREAITDDDRWKASW